MVLFRKKEGWGRFGLKAGASLLILWMAGSAFAGRYRIGIDEQLSKCLPGYTFFLVDLKDQSLERGGIYAFEARGMSPIYEDGTQMVKVLAGLPGDTVEIGPSETEWGVMPTVQVNGEHVGFGLDLAHRLEQPEEKFYGKSVLQEGNYWFMGKSPVSFDSRYWGTVADEQIIGRTYPLF